MKPINLENNDNKIPTSSNCIILESLGIDCSVIEDENLGATITNMLEQMVYLLDAFSIKTYDAKCLGDDCGPKTFEEVFQMLMDAICNLSPEEVIVICDTCLLNIDNCIVVNESININDYIVLIGEKICELQTTITTLSNEVENHEIRITALENTDAPQIPFGPVEAVCSLNPQTTDIVTLTKAFDKMFCAFEAFHGDPSLIDGKLDLACQILPDGEVPPIYATNTYANILSRLWTATCLLRTELVALTENCCGGAPVGCPGEDFVIDFSRNADVVSLGVTGSLTAGYIEGSSFVTVTDINNVVYTENVIVSNYIGSTIQITVPNTLDLTDTFVVDIEIITLNVSLGAIECSSIYTETLYNVICATIIDVFVLFNEINFGLVYNENVSTDYVITLSDGITPVVQNLTVNSPSTTLVTFGSLLPETEYTLTIVTLAPNLDPIVCEEEIYTTPAAPCSAAFTLSIDGLV